MIKTGCELLPAKNGYWETDGPRDEPMTVANLIEILKTHDPKAHVLDPYYGIDYGPHSGRLKPQKDGTPCVFISRYEVDYD